MLDSYHEGWSMWSCLGIPFYKGMFFFMECKLFRKQNTWHDLLIKSAIQIQCNDDWTSLKHACLWPWNTLVMDQFNDKKYQNHLFLLIITLYSFCNDILWNFKEEVKNFSLPLCQCYKYFYYNCLLVILHMFIFTVNLLFSSRLFLTCMAGFAIP